MYAYDVMILKLAKNSTKPFLKIRESSPVLGAKLTTIGLGVTNTGLSEFPVRLNEVELGYVQNDQCQVFHTDDVEISNDMLCTMGDKKDACIGDGGGPLFIKGSSVEDDELVGTFSV